MTDAVFGTVTESVSLTDISLVALRHYPGGPFAALADRLRAGHQAAQARGPPRRHASCQLALIAALRTAHCAERACCERLCREVSKPRGRPPASKTGGFVRGRVAMPRYEAPR